MRGNAAVDDAVWRDAADVSLQALQRHVDPAIEAFDLAEEASSWARHLRLRARCADGRVLPLRVKLCTGTTFGRSEVDYYRRDYADLADAKAMEAGRKLVGEPAKLIAKARGSVAIAYRDIANASEAVE